jgi:CheY-like chemotaxis protein
MNPAARPLILLVEDSDDSRELLAECLELSGFQVRAARDGLEAVAAASRAPQPDVVLMDLGLPRVDGVEATRRLKSDARTRRIPVLAFTGYPAGDPDARRAGFAAFITKPCTPDVLTAAIREALDESLTAAV